MAKLSSDHHHHHHQFDPQGINNNSSNNPSGLLGRDSAEIEHAQLLSELGGGGGGAMQQTHAHLDTQNVLVGKKNLSLLKSKFYRQVYIKNVSFLESMNVVQTHVKVVIIFLVF